MGTRPPRWGTHLGTSPCPRDEKTLGETFPHVPLLGKHGETSPVTEGVPKKGECLDVPHNQWGDAQTSPFARLQETPSFGHVSVFEMLGNAE